MMKPVKTDVGVIVGRFHVHDLHQAHIELIQTVTNEHPKVILFLGLSPCKVTVRNPLDFESRKQMILEKFPDITVQYIKDIPGDDEVWSKKLDEQISDLVGPKTTVTLYGSRDSFIPHYKGRYKTQELEQTRYVSGTELRREISAKVKKSPDFRAGVIWAVNNQYDKVYPTVDAVIFSSNGTRLLLAKKPHETKLRFVGGFAERKGSYEDDVKREVAEETGLEVSEPEYLGSFTVDDPRYRSENDKIKTAVFVVKHVFGAPKANDDIAELYWVDLEKFRCDMLVKEHYPIFDLLYAKGFIPSRKEQE